MPCSWQTGAPSGEAQLTRAILRARGAAALQGPVLGGDRPGAAREVGGGRVGGPAHIMVPVSALAALRSSGRSRSECPHHGRKNSTKKPDSLWRASALFHDWAVSSASPLHSKSCRNGVQHGRQSRGAGVDALYPCQGEWSGSNLASVVRNGALLRRCAWQPQRCYTQQSKRADSTPRSGPPRMPSTIAVTAIAPSLLAPAAGAPPAAARWCQREHEEKARLGFSSAEQEFVQGVCSTNCARLVGGWSRPRRNSTRAARTVAQDVLAPSRGSPCSLTSTAPVYLRPGRIRCALAPLHRAARTRVTARAPAPTRVDLLPTVSTFLPHRSLGGFSSLHLQCTSSLAQLRAGHRQADAPLAQSGARVRATGTVP